jgi:hypothetical protein
MSAPPKASAALAAPSYGHVTRTMRPSNPHDPEYGLLPIYAPGLAEVKAAFKRHMRLRRLPTWALFSSIYATVASG